MKEYDPELADELYSLYSGVNYDNLNEFGRAEWKRDVERMNLGRLDFDEPDFHETTVGPNSDRTLFLPTTDKKICTVSTVARIGCDSALIWTEGEEDTLFMSHYEPNKLDDHLDSLDRYTQAPSENVHAVLLTATLPTDTLTDRLIDKVHQVAGVKPDVVRLVEEALEPDALNNMQKDPEIYQLVAVKGVSEDPKHRRIYVPTLRGGKKVNQYDKQLTGKRIH